MASPDHAAKRPATALIRAFLDMPSEDRFQTVMEDPSTLDALLIEADALVAALAQAEGERDEAETTHFHIVTLCKARAERAERQRDQAIGALREITETRAGAVTADLMLEIARDALAAIEKDTA